ncbi:coiled-coil domain-containing protein 42 homolog [Amphibalanus amphitrite]|nr:coiled-coil domain-containing protein 42 homolog [Amphibalanus amphitrite]
MKKTDIMNRNLEDYFKIQFENKIAVRPRREDCHLAAATKILAKRNEVEETDKELEMRKEWFKEKMSEIRTGREALADRENALKQEMLRYEKFFRENTLKRHRGERKSMEEREYQAKKDSEIAALKEELKELEERKDEMQKAVNSNSKFRDFLLKATAFNPDYEEINDLLSRCDVLWATQKELLDREQHDAQILDQETLSLIASSEHLSTNVLRLNNLISELHLRYERAQNNVAAWENSWTRIKNTAAKQTLQLGQVKMAIHNLYQLCQRYHRERALEHEEVIEYTEPGDQMNTVAELMQDIGAVYKECCRRARQAAAKASAHETPPLSD